MDESAARLFQPTAPALVDAVGAASGAIELPAAVTRGGDGKAWTVPGCVGGAAD